MARKGGGLRHHTWQQENEILDQGFGLNLSANQMAGFWPIKRIILSNDSVVVRTAVL